MSKYRVALIGCGWVAGEHIKAYQNNPDTEVAALVSSDSNRANAIIDAHRLQANVYTDVGQMLDAEKPDIVSITSRPDLHVQQAITVSNAGAHIVMEKPAAMNLGELKQLQQTLKQNNTKSIVSFVLRWNPLFGIIRSILDKQMLGDIFYGEVDYYHGIGPQYRQFVWNKTKSSGGNTLLSAGCHALDALVWFYGAKVKEVTAFATRSTSQVYSAYEYEPTLLTVLRFEDGRIGKVTSCIECNAPYRFPIQLYGTEGSLLENKLFCDTLKGQSHYATIPTILPDSGDVTHHPFQGEINEFVDCLNEGKDSTVNIDYAAHIMQICFAAEQSATSGQLVQLEG